MANSITQRSFSSGELDPTFFSRVDMAKYAAGLRALRNMYVRKNGGVDNRGGTIYLEEGKSRTKKHRLIPFQLSLDIKFQLEVGEFYIRFIKNDVYVTDSTKAITAITQANPGVFTSVAHGFTNGQELELNGINGMVELNNRNFFVANAAANTYELTYRDGVPVNTTNFGAYISGGTASRVYEISTPYAEADIPFLQYSQSASVMNITHQLYPPAELRLFSDANWLYSENDFSPQGYVLAFTIAGPLGAIPILYAVTAIASATGEETIPIPFDNYSITSITNGFPSTVTTSVAHNHLNGERVRMILPIGSGMRQLNFRIFTVKAVTANTFQIQGEDTTSYAPYTAGGTLDFLTFGTLWAAPTPAAPIVFTLPDAPGFREYNIYKSVNGGTFGIIGISKGLTFNDEGFDPNTSISFPEGTNPFRFPGDYPATSAYVQQRLFFANTINRPEDLWGSAIGGYGNFSRISPSNDDESLQFALAGEQVNPVRHIFNLGSMTMLTDVAEWICNGDNNGSLTPTNISPKQQSGNGASYVKPVIIDFSAIYIQEQGEIVRDFRSDLQGGDLSAFSHHLFKNKKVISIAYQKTQNSIVWFVFDDGSCVSMTYIREQQIIGFARHDFQGGFVEDVSTYRNAGEYEVFFVVRRTIDGQTRRYNERLFTRKIVDIIDNIFMDSALTYDGRSDGTRTMTLSGGVTWSQNETLTLTASSAFFTAADVGNEIWFYSSSDLVLLRFKINAYTSTTVVTGKATTDVPVALQVSPLTEWARAVDEVSGLWHLEGESLSVFADRNVVASPNNKDENGDPKYEVCVVEDGKIQFERCHAVIHAGIPFISDLETLDVDTAQGESMQNKNKLTATVTGRFTDTRGVFIGPEEPTGSDLLHNMYELKMRNEEIYDSPIELRNGLATLNIDAKWNNNGRVFIRQVDPLPLSLESITGEGLFPSKGGA